MSYRISSSVRPLVWAEASVEHKGGRVEYLVKVRAQFKRRSTANNVEIYVPVPDDADTPKFRVSLPAVLASAPMTKSCRAGIDGHGPVCPSEVVLCLEDEAASRRP